MQNILGNSPGLHVELRHPQAISSDDCVSQDAYYIVMPRTFSPEATAHAVHTASPLLLCGDAKSVLCYLLRKGAQEPAGTWKEPSMPWCAELDVVNCALPSKGARGA